MRGYYGSVSHNVKAVYQRYLSWYDANPCNLHPLPPAPAARKFVEYMGGAAAVIERARADFAKGEFRWVAQVMKEVVYAEPGNEQAGRCARLRWSRWATRPSPQPGATPSSMARRSCATASSRCRCGPEWAPTLWRGSPATSSST